MRYLIGLFACRHSRPSREPRTRQTVGATTGTINGKVVDPSDAVLPGVTVTISAPQMQGEQTAVTNADGNYRFPGIPPGTYRVTYELPGFAQVVREGIRVTLGFTATLNVTMQVSGLQETVTVTGDSPVVDVSSTKTSTNYDYKELASIPSARDMWAILAESPGVTMARIDVGGSAAGTQSGYRTYDARGDQNRVMIDGLVTTEGTGAIGVYVDYGAFEEVTAGTAGHGADMGQPGVQTQMMIKSGGNQFHGSVYGDYQNSSLQAHQHHRRADRARHPRQGSQPHEGLLRLQRRRRRLREEGQAVVVRLVSRVRHRDQRAALPGQAVSDQAAALQRQDDVLAAREQQDHRLVHADAEDPAEPPRRHAHHQPHQPDRRIDAESAALGVGLQGRVEQGAERHACSPKCAAGSSATTGRSCPTRTRPGRASRISRPASSPGRTSIGSRTGAATRSSARSATSRTVCAAATTSSSAARSSTRRSSRSSSRRRTATRRSRTSATACRRKSSCSIRARSRRR